MKTSLPLTANEETTALVLTNVPAYCVIKIPLYDKNPHAKP
ncbi:MAG: hypothetical protein ACR2H1_10475 [Limisphaerales bacterium]